MARRVWTVSSADLSRRGFLNLRLAAARFGFRQGPTRRLAVALAKLVHFSLSLKTCLLHRAKGARSFPGCVSTMEL